MVNYAGDLLKNGYVVIPTNTFKNPAIKRDVLDEATRFPEFQDGVKKYVMGGFGAVNTASGFHNPMSRKIRQWAHPILVTKVFSEVSRLYGGDWNLEQMIDRIVIRNAGEKPSAESFHRDESTSEIASDDDKIFGGWVCLDSKDQYFSCVPCSHRPNSTQHRGFAKIKKSTALRLKKERMVRKVVIPPGAILIFFENIIHEVVSKSFNYTLVRQHLAFRLTRSTDIRPANLMSKIDDQAVIMLKSGQIGPMHAKLHWVNWVEKLNKWAVESLDERLLISRTFEKGKHAGETWIVPVEHALSLREYGMEMYSPYSDDEKRLSTPQTSWRVLKPGFSDTYINVSL